MYICFFGMQDRYIFHRQSNKCYFIYVYLKLNLLMLLNKILDQEKSVLNLNSFNILFTYHCSSFEDRRRPPIEERDEYDDIYDRIGSHGKNMILFCCFLYYIVDWQ
jgi:hypothetical protein